MHSNITRDMQFEFLDNAQIGCYEHEQLKEHGDQKWLVNSSTFADYSRRANLLGRVSGLFDIINEQIGHSQDNVGIDIAAGSTPQALRDLLDCDLLSSALSTNFEDRRPRWIKRDARLDHIAGDLITPATWSRIAQWKDHNAPEGFALAMHRPVGGLQSLDARVYFGAAHMVLDMVRPNGLMFTQIPRGVSSSILPHLCASIRARSDVANVITSPPHRIVTPSLYYENIDEYDKYAVIIKR